MSNWRFICKAPRLPRHAWALRCSLLVAGCIVLLCVFAPTGLSTSVVTFNKDQSRNTNLASCFSRCNYQCHPGIMKYFVGTSMRYLASGSCFSWRGVQYRLQQIQRDITRQICNQAVEWTSSGQQYLGRVGGQLYPSGKQAPDNQMSFVFPKGRSVIETPIDELSDLLGGSDQAIAMWRAFREGNSSLDARSKKMNKGVTKKARQHLRNLHGSSSYEQERETVVVPSQTLDDLLIPCVVEVEIPSSCGGRKFLSTLHDGKQIESVLIPRYAHSKATTLCVSTQVGCDRACAFCATAKMGFVRNLTAAEIIAQVLRGLQISKRESLPALTNIVFMGMGDAGRNLDEVSAALRCITDQKRLDFSKFKVCVSTVGPSPATFQTIADMPCTMAWSLHAADNALRKKLVPSTRHTIEELRDGLISALASRRPSRSKGLLIAITLIDAINDSRHDAERLAYFLRPVLNAIPNFIVNLIPYNDIHKEGFSRPSDERILDFQRTLQDEGYSVSVRLTRGEAESAACGMLKTLRQKSLV